MSLKQNWSSGSRGFRSSAGRSRWQSSKISLLVGLFILLGAVSIFGQGYPYDDGNDAWDGVSESEVGLNKAKLQLFLDFVCKPIIGNEDDKNTAVFISRFGKKVNLANSGYTINGVELESAHAPYSQDIASSFKPFISHFLFKAIEQNRIIKYDPDKDELDQEVKNWEPDLVNLNPILPAPYLSNKDELITWRHLANQTSCYGVMETPGTAFAYCDYQSTLLWDVLFKRVWDAEFGLGTRTVDYILKTELTDKLQFQDTVTLLEPQSDPQKMGRMRISARDFVRFGLLYLRNGLWKGEQIISTNAVNLAKNDVVTVPRSIYNTYLTSTEYKNFAACIDLNNSGSGAPFDNHPELNIKVIDCERNFAENSTKLRARDQADHNGGYGWFWWKNKNQTLWPGVPADTFACVGRNGLHAMVVIPEYDIVACWLNSAVNDDSGNFPQTTQKDTAEAIKRLISAACKTPGAPTITGPTNNSTLAILRPTITWTPAETAPYTPVVDDFMVRIHLGEEAVYTRLTGTETSDQVAFGKLLNRNSYLLSVRAHNSCGWGNWSDVVNFSIDVPGSKPAAPTLISPANFATVNKTPTLTWSEVSANPNVDNYKLQVLLNDVVVYEELTEMATSHTIPNGHLLVGSNYKWMVKAHNDKGWSVWSGFRRICVR
jgi:hypothetical protein